MEPINLVQFRTQIAGSPYKSFVEHHLRRQSSKELEVALRGTIEMLPSWVLPFMESFIDEWNETARYADFWKADCDIVFSLICQHAQNVADAGGYVLDDETAFNIFQMVTLNLASTASRSRELRRLAGIRKGIFG